MTELGANTSQHRDFRGARQPNAKAPLLNPFEAVEWLKLEARAAMQRGDLSKAGEFARKGVKRAASSNASSLVMAEALEVRGEFLCLSEELEAARDTYSRALRLLASPRLMTELFCRARLESKLGQCLRFIGETEKAKDLNRAALTTFNLLRRHSSNPDSLLSRNFNSDVTAEHSLALWRFAQLADCGALDKRVLLGALKRSIRLRRSVSGPVTDDEVFLRCEVADRCSEFGDFEASTAQYKKALRILASRCPEGTSLPPVEHRDRVIRLQLELARSQLTSDGVVAAERTLLEALELLYFYPTQDNKLFAAAWAMEAEMTYVKGRPRRALSLQTQAVQLQLTGAFDSGEAAKCLSQLAWLVGAAAEPLEKRFLRWVRSLCCNTEIAPEIRRFALSELGALFFDAGHARLCAACTLSHNRLLLGNGAPERVQRAMNSLILAKCHAAVGDERAALRSLQRAYEEYPLQHGDFRTFELAVRETRVAVLDAFPSNVEAVAEELRTIMRLAKRYTDASPRTEVLNRRRLVAHYLNNGEIDSALADLPALKAATARLDLTKERDRCALCLSTAIEASAKLHAGDEAETRRLLIAAIEQAATLAECEPTQFKMLLHNAGEFFASQYQSKRESADLHRALQYFIQSEKVADSEETQEMSVQRRCRLKCIFLFSREIGDTAQAKMALEKLRSLERLQEPDDGESDTESGFVNS